MAGETKKGISNAPKKAGSTTTEFTKAEIQKRIKELLKKGKKQHYITYEDIDNAFPPDYEGFDSSLVEVIYEEFELPFSRNPPTPRKILRKLKKAKIYPRSSNKKNLKCTITFL